MPDKGNISGHTTQFVYDALKERLPHNWSLARENAPSMDGSGKHSAFYKWTKWTTGDFIQIEVHEDYASPITVDQLCDNLMDAVFDMFNDPQARYTTPIWEKQKKQLEALNAQ